MNKLPRLITQSRRHFSVLNSKTLSITEASDTFPRRHNHQPDASVDPSGSVKITQMLKTLGVDSLEELITKTVPASIYKPDILSKLDSLFPHKSNGDVVDGESDVLREFYQEYANQNKKVKNFIGMGYYGTKTPTVILRNVLENPGWYTQYTPYQAEISQGRLESLLNYQTMIADLTGLPISNASLLDEGTSAAEAMVMCYNIWSSKMKLKDSQVNQTPCRFFVSSDVHPQTISLLRTRAEPKKIQVIVADASQVDVAKVMSTSEVPYFGAMIQYPNTEGQIHDYSQFTTQVHQQGGMVVAATDLLALTLIKSPGELGMDIAVGTNQRFGIPMGYGGPHAGFLATKDEFKRIIPGRLIGVSKDIHGNRALRMALQTREQHIRRDKATSNICTAQALLSNISAFYAIYHGPDGLKKIATTVHEKTVFLATYLQQLGYKIFNGEKALYFDTIRIDMEYPEQVQTIRRAAETEGLNFRYMPNGKSIGISLDETTSIEDLSRILNIFSTSSPYEIDAESLQANTVSNLISQSHYQRQTKFLQQEVFNSMHTEHELLRYIFKLQSRDISLAHSMIPLGSCTMKLNSTSEMIPITWSEFGNIHPFAPTDQTVGYQKMFRDLETWLALITGFDAVSLQPNAGSQGEYAGLLAIKKYHESRFESHRNVCLIPTSAHGTNAASAAMVGMKVVVVECDSKGNVDVEDLKKKAEENSKNLSAIMVTYPSTHGVFEERIKEICDIVHSHGGQVYMDGANMNAQVGITSPGSIGADVCHLNLHKTFCIPHGGGGPGMGPICVKSQLAPFLPSHSVIPVNSSYSSFVQISAAPWGSASILPISWMYIRMMGGKGLRTATELAILNANYMAKRLEPYYRVYYKGSNGFVAHEFILDCAPFKKSADIQSEDIAKRLMDYGFHAPTQSFPIANTLMIEPTESESKEELDRYIDALISIRKEIEEIETGKADKKDNVLKNAPHTATHVMSDQWNHNYSREKAAYPLPYLKEFKFWPHVGRIDGPYGDKNLICTCEPIDSYREKHE